LSNQQGIRVTKVSDSLSNANDQIARAAKILGRSKDKTAVFKAVCHGKKKRVTVEDIMQRTRMKRKRVLEDAAKLANQLLIVKHRENGEVVYERDSFLAANRQKILSLASNRRKLDKFATKTNPRGGVNSTVTIAFPRKQVRTRMVTIDDIDSFAAVVGTVAMGEKLTGMSERTLKEGMQRIIGEPGTFTDWGGEKNDLYSTRLRYKGARRSVAFAFKGPGKRGTLTPGKLGKNGDQIQRLFESRADFYFVQYYDRIAESVTDQMDLIAKSKSYSETREIFWGIIDGTDSVRLVAAYRSKFFPPNRQGAKRASKKRTANR
jgi:hypothetical protein